MLQLHFAIILISEIRGRQRRSWRSSGVTNVGVVRCGNWWCHPIFPQK